MTDSKLMATAENRQKGKILPLLKGTLVKWNDQKGFGFIRMDEHDDDYFVHISSFKKGSSRRPEVGDTVKFKPADLPGKKRVSFARIEGLEYESQEPKAVVEKKPFVLEPKQRTFLTNFLILLPLFLSGYLLITARNPLPFFSYVIFSILTMFIYGRDKAHAAIRSWRIPESYLHVLEIMGGWPGALMAQNDFRHKTRKSVYQLVFKGIILLHLLAWAFYFYWSYKPELM